MKDFRHGHDSAGPDPKNSASPLTMSQAEREELLVRVVRIQQLGWSFAKQMRDQFDSLLRSAESTLEEMQKLGMDDHLPTISEMCGILGKTPKQIEALNRAARERVAKRIGLKNAEKYRS